MPVDTRTDLTVVLPKAAVTSSALQFTLKRKVSAREFQASLQDSLDFASKIKDFLVMGASECLHQCFLVLNVSLGFRHVPFRHLQHRFGAQPLTAVAG